MLGATVTTDDKRVRGDDDDGDDLRVQFSFHYSFSTKDIFKKNARESGT